MGREREGGEAFCVGAAQCDGCLVVTFSIRIGVPQRCGITFPWSYATWVHLLFQVRASPMGPVATETAPTSACVPRRGQARTASWPRLRAFRADAGQTRCALSKTAGKTAPRA